MIFSGILIALAGVYFYTERMHLKAVAVALVLFLLCCIFGHRSSFAFWEKDLSYEGESVYNYLQVKENDANVILSTNVLFGVQSLYRKDGGLTGMYYDVAMAAPFLAGEPEEPNILILGMGSGTYATQCSRYLEHPTIAGVEIDEAIIDLSRRYFYQPDDVAVAEYDGRAYLDADENLYDVIMVDAYQDITIPFQMSSREFFKSVYDHLDRDGIMVVNLNMRSDTAGNINEYLLDTIASVFADVMTCDVAYSSNREVFAAKDADMLARFDEITEHLADEAASARDSAVPDEKDSLRFSPSEASGQYSPLLLDQLRFVRDNLIAYDAGERILTDDKAPVELLGIAVIDELITDELAYYKAVYERDGLRGLMKGL